MTEGKTVELSEEHYNSLKLKQMRAEICEMAMKIESDKFIEFCHHFMEAEYQKEVIDQAVTIDEIAEDIPNNLLFIILSLFKDEPENTRVKEQVIDYFEKEIEVRRQCGLLPAGNM